ncbi:putative GTP-binding protein 6 [Rhynchonycteris naso]
MAVRTEARGHAPWRSAGLGMWTLGAVVRGGAFLSRLARGRSARRVTASSPPPFPQRSLAAFVPEGPRETCRGAENGGRDPRADGRRSRAGEVEDEEEEKLLRREPLLPAGHSGCFWCTPRSRLDSSLVVERMMVSTKVPDRKLVFGKGTLEHLTGWSCARVPAPFCLWLLIVASQFTAVMAGGSLLPKQLEAAWGVHVFNRFTVVLHIFRCNARTKEARLQVALAELPVLRSGLKDRIAPLDGHGGSSRYILGSGELFMQLPQRLMREQEMKMRKALERLRDKWQLLGC